MEKFDNISIPWSGWRIIRKLGSGGFGSVYEIERDLFGKKEKAALKIIEIPPDQGAVEEDYDNGYDHDSIVRKYSHYLKKTVQEYQAMVEMRGHTNIVNCYDFAVQPHSEGIGWTVCIRMELLTPLNKIMRTREFTEKDIIQVGIDVCKALVLCEKKNMIHRDIKPENIMVSEFGEYKLGDFGLARVLEHTRSVTRAGTDWYWAPEIDRGDQCGRDVDTYSLGIVLYQLLNNYRIPFVPLSQPVSGQTIKKAIGRRLSGERIPEPLNGSARLKQVVLKACSYDRRDRYRSAREMLEDLQNVDSEKSIEPEVKKRTETVHKICGIHFGSSRVCVSEFAQNQCHTVLTMPAYVVISVTGEILTGRKAVEYKQLHDDVPVYSVYEILKSAKWREGIFKYKGAGIAVGDICTALLIELREELDRAGCSYIREFVLSVSLCSYIGQNFLMKYMRSAGFEVHRILNASVACAINNVYNQSPNRYHIDCTLEEDVIEISLTDYSDGVLEVLHTTECMIDSSQYREGENISHQGYNQLLAECPEYREEMGKTSARIYGDSRSRRYFGYQEKNAYDLNEAAAAGAALQGAKLCGYDALKNFLLLDVTTEAFGIEIVGEQNRTLRELEWIIEEQTTIPVKHKMVYERQKNRTRGNSEWLRLYIGCSNKAGSSYTTDLSLKDIFGLFRYTPQKLEITLSMGLAGELDVILTNMEDNESATIHIFRNAEVKGLMSV